MSAQPKPREKWEHVFRTAELRYGCDCRRCGRLLAFEDHRLCRFCRKPRPA